MGSGIDTIASDMTSIVSIMMTIFSIMGVMLLISGFFSLARSSQSGEGSDGAFIKMFVGILMVGGPSLLSSLFSDEVTQIVNTAPKSPVKDNSPVKDAVQHVSVTYQQAAHSEPFDWSIFIPVLKFIGYGLSIFAILCVLYFSVALFVSFLNVKKSLTFIGLEENFLTITKNKEQIEKQIKKNSRKLFKLPEFMNQKILKINEMLEDKNRKYQAVIEQYKQEITGN